MIEKGKGLTVMGAMISDTARKSKDQNGTMEDLSKPSES